MTFNQTPGESELTAYDIVNHFSEENLADVIYGFGGERRARRIAAAIVEARQHQRIKTTDQLVKIIETSCFHEEELRFTQQHKPSRHFELQ